MRSNGNEEGPVKRLTRVCHGTYAPSVVERKGAVHMKVQFRIFLRLEAASS